MSLFRSFSSALNIPIQNAVSSATAVATAAVSGVVSSAAQQISNFISPSTAQKQAEAIAKVATEGTGNKFSNLTPGKINMVTANGKIYAVDSSTQQRIGSVGTVLNESIPASVAQQLVNPEDRTDSFKIRITQLSSSVAPIVFDVMPTISESRSATYDSPQIIHHPGEILKYKSTANRTWRLETRLISRTPEEAAANLKTINIIRSWVMPYYGEGTALGTEGSKLGAPPPILKLEGYGEKMIGPISCVLESYSWNFPNDVDYIRVEGDEIPFPVILNISLDLKEALSPAEFSGFDLVAYRKGELSKSWIPIKNRSQSTGSSSAAGAAAGNSSNKSEPKRGS